MKCTGVLQFSRWICQLPHSGTIFQWKRCNKGMIQSGYKKDQRTKGPMKTSVWLLETRTGNGTPERQCYLHKERAYQCFAAYAGADWEPGGTAFVLFDDGHVRLEEVCLNTETAALQPPVLAPGEEDVYMEVFPNWEGALPHLPTGTILPRRAAPYTAQMKPGSSGLWVRVSASACTSGICGIVCTVTFAEGVVTAGLRQAQ